MKNCSLFYREEKMKKRVDTVNNIIDINVPQAAVLAAVGMAENAQDPLVSGMTQEVNPILKFVSELRSKLCPQAKYLNRWVAASTVIVTTAALSVTASAQDTINRNFLPGNSLFASQNRKPFNLEDQKAIPHDLTVRDLNGVAGVDTTKQGDKPATSRIQIGGLNGNNVLEQIVNATLPPVTAPSTDQLHPVWTLDERFLFYVNNNNPTGLYQIYRLDANASATAATNAILPTPVPISNDLKGTYAFPAIDTNTLRISYTKTSSDGIAYDASALGKAHLYASRLPAPGGTLDNIVGGATDLRPLTLVRNAQGKFEARRFRGRRFEEVQRSAWVGATVIVFSARLEAVPGNNDVSFHLFTVDTDTGFIYQLTTGPANEKNPQVSPDSKYVAFDSDAIRSTNGLSYSNGQAPRPNTPDGGDFSPGTPDGDPAISLGTNNGVRNIYVMSPVGGPTNPALPIGQTNLIGGLPRQVTGRYTNAPDLDNIQPSWSFFRPDRFLDNNNNISNRTLYFLAFASKRKLNTGSTSQYIADAKYDIYTFPFTRDNGVTIATESSTTVTGTKAIRLDTVDPTNTYNDEYPTWAPGNNIFRIGFQSDRSGSLVSHNFPTTNSFAPTATHDLFLSSVLDYSAPTLIRYNTGSATGEIVHINLGDTYNANQSVRTGADGIIPSQKLFFTVRAEDREAAWQNADSIKIYLQFKNPNSKYQSTAQGGFGVEHKEWTNSSANFASGAGIPSQFGVASRLWISATDIPEFRDFGGSVNALGRPNVYGYEYEAQVVGLNGTSYFGHNFATTNVVVGPKMYEAGQDDRNAFTASNNPPMLGQDAQHPSCWLELKRLNDLPADGQGGVLYGATWNIPVEASDWYIDVIAVDNAVNPYDIRPNASTGNWIMYDNVWGFSSARPISPQEVDVLFVADYTLGQKFFRPRFGQTAQGANLQPIFFGAESYYTDPQMTLYPSEIPGASAPPTAGGTTGRSWDTFGPFANGVSVPSPLGVGSYDDTIIPDVRIPETNGKSYPLPQTGRYSIWRILSRGPVPTDTLRAYLPTKTTSPVDIVAGEDKEKDPNDPTGKAFKTLREVTVYNRYVVWASPFAGNVFAGPGSITDVRTQEDLTRFVNDGGRFFISGMDIGFALSGPGRSNTFYDNVLSANFLTDSVTPNASVTASTGERNITHAAWDVNYYDWSKTPVWPFYGPDNEPWQTSPPNTAGINQVVDGSMISQTVAGNYVDVISTKGSAVPLFNFTVGGNPGYILNNLSSGGKVVYSSVGFESMSNNWYTYPTNVMGNKGRRAEVMFNIGSWFRTGRITGRLIDDQGAPIGDALVRAISNGNPTAKAVGTALTDQNGYFTITGLPPAGGYEVYGYKQGYYTQHTSAISLHGGSVNDISLALRRAAPGQLSNIDQTKQGGVFLSDGKTGIGGIEIQLRRLLPSGKYFAVSAFSSDGTDGKPVGSYTLPNIAIGQYTVIANPRQYVNADGVLANYGPVDPQPNRAFSEVILTKTPQANIIVGAGTNIVNTTSTVTNIPSAELVIEENKTAKLDFILVGASQPVIGKVCLVDGGVETPAKNIAVTATDIATNIVVASGITDTNGNYSLTLVGTTETLLPAGTYRIDASEPGYSVATQTVSVGSGTIGVINVPKLKLTLLPPGDTLTGLVTNAKGEPVSGAKVTLYPIRQGKPDLTRGTVITTGAVVGTGSATYNYIIKSLPAGTYIAVAEKDGLVGDPNPFTNIVVVSAGINRSINFRLLPPKIYPAGLSLISLPYDYSNVTDSNGNSINAEGNKIFGATSDLFRVAEWTGTEWRVGNNIPIRLGKGYFVRFDTTTALPRTGQAWPGSTFTIELTPGWNLIGHPFVNPLSPTVPAGEIDINSAQVQDGGQTYTMIQAASNGLVKNVLFSYVGSLGSSQYIQTNALKPWFGYWIRNISGRTVQLVLTNPATRATTTSLTAPFVSASGANAVPALVRSLKTGNIMDWRLRLGARSGDSVDADNVIGVSPEAKDGFDNRFDAQKPPMVTMESGETTGVYLSMEAPNETGRSVAFADDIRSAGTGTKTWDVKVEAPVAGEVTVFWPNVSQLPRGVEPILVDLANGKRTALRSTAGYKFYANAGTTHRFRVEVGTPKTLPLDILSVKTAGPTRGKSSTYRFAVLTTQDAEVNLEVKNLQGQTIRRLTTRSVAGKEAMILWDGRAASGNPLPAGPYTVSVTVRDTSGATAQRSIPTVSVR
jgi:hypothetical protein